MLFELLFTACHCMRKPCACTLSSERNLTVIVRPVDRTVNGCDEPQYLPRTLDESDGPSNSCHENVYRAIVVFAITSLISVGAVVTYFYVVVGARVTAFKRKIDEVRSNDASHRNSNVPRDVLQARVAVRVVW